MILKTKKINSLSKLPEQAHKGDMYNFIYFLQQNQEATNLIPLVLYKQIIKVIRQEDKKTKRKLLKSTSPYIFKLFLIIIINISHHFIIVLK